MKLFDKKAARIAWIGILTSIPIMFFVMWKETGEIGMTEVLIASGALIIAIASLYFTKWYSNKNK